jgi:hypothetical protein
MAYRSTITFVFPVVTAALFGCQRYPELIDYGRVCVTAEQIGDQHRVVVEANSEDCAADHDGATLACSINSDAAKVQIETVFQDGKDPNDGCGGPLTATCTLEVEPGTYTMAFGDEQAELTVPSNDRLCLPTGSGESGD